MGKTILFTAIALLTAVASCTGTGCKCPASGCDNCSSSSTGYAVFYVLPDAGGVSSLTADSSCSATFETTDRMTVSRLGPGACTVRISYGDGATYTFHVEVTPEQGGCGCYLSSTITLESMDGGPP
jgi:hypothetical protein